MHHVDALQRFARFRAASVATDVSDIDVAVDLGEASTDAHIPRRLTDLMRRLFSMEARGLGGGWAPGDADFDVLDHLGTPKGQIQGQIRALRVGGCLPYSERLARRLDFLLEALEEEGEAWEKSSPDSLRQMFLFLQSVPDFRCPTVSITPSATFRAQWDAGRNSHLAIDFLPDGQVRFVVFSPDLRHPGRVRRVSGIVGRLDLIRVLEPYDVHRWAAGART